MAGPNRATDDELRCKLGSCTTLRHAAGLTHPRSVWRGVWFAGITGAAAVMLWGNAARAQSGDGDAAGGPSLAVAKQAYALAEAWAQRGRTPDQTVSIEAEGVSAICVTLRLQGARLGRATASVERPARQAGSGEAIDLSPMLKRATAAALAEARDALPKLEGRIDGQPIPDDLERVAPMITLDLQLAGPPRSLNLGHRRDLLRRVVPGLHGLAAQRGDRWAWLFPGTVIETNLSLPGQLQRLFGALNLPPDASAAIGTDEAPPLYRFEAVHLVRLSPNRPTTALRRGQTLMPTEPLNLARARRFADLWAMRLRQWQHDSGHLPGTYQPTADRFQPERASPVDAALACLALGRYARLERLDEEAAEAAAKAARDGLRATLEQIGMDVEAANPTPDDASALSTAAAAILVAAIADTPGAGALKPARDELADLALAAREPGGGFRRAASGRADPAPAPQQALIAHALVRLYDHTRRRDALEAAQAAMSRLWREHDQREAVALLPWIALAEQDLHRLGKGTPGLLALRETLRAVRAAQVTAADDSDALEPGAVREAIGGFKLQSGLVDEPTWHSARPLIALAAALPNERFVGREDQSQWLVDAALGLRFLAQLTLTRDAAWYARQPSRAIGGVRTAFWDNRQPVPATALALLAAVEFDHSVRALATQRNRNQPAGDPPDPK